MLPALVILVQTPLMVEIDAPKTVRLGEPFHVVARLVNRSPEFVTIVRPEVSGSGLGLSFGGGLFLDGKIVPTTLGGRQAGQWVLPQRYGLESFTTLRPGESTPIEDIEYRQVYAKTFSGLKRDLRTTPTAHLAPGEYTIRFSYRFRRVFHVNRLRWSGRRPELNPVGRALYKQAWTGEVTASVPLTVNGA